MLSARRLFLLLLSLLFLIFPLSATSEETHKTLETKYTTIYYYNDRDIDKFMWKIGGERLNMEIDINLAKYRVDRIIERVQDILDMHPENMRVDIFLSDKYKEINEVAFYSHKRKAVYMVTDNVKDGVLAHEMAHAVICFYFGSPPPVKMQEILAQYVDRHLWEEHRKK